LRSYKRRGCLKRERESSGFGQVSVRRGLSLEMFAMLRPATQYRRTLEAMM
jgi:hypothetical protein